MSQSEGTIKKTAHKWGTRLEAYPIADMYIQADISKRPGQGVDVRFFFSGTTVQTPLRLSDIRVWMEYMQAMFAAAQEAAK